MVGARSAVGRGRPVTRRRVLSLEERRRLAGALTSAAAEMVARRYDGDLEAEREAREVVARWLRNLPGLDWDVRLPDPSTLGPDR